MSDSRFDLCFDGTLQPDADPELVRQHLAVAFKLDAQGLDRLFCGKRVFIRREVDVATAAKLERVFRQAGALLQIIPLDAASPPPGDPGAAPVQRPETPVEPDPPADPSGLSLAPAGGFLETLPAVKMPDLDTSHLSLVSGADWTLADCEPTQTPTRVADTSHLTLVEMDPSPDSRDSLD